MTVQTTSLLPQLSGSLLPPASPAQGLTEDETALIAALSSKLTFLSTPMRIAQMYYDGLQRLADLGVSIPPALASVRTVVDWPRICVDPLVDRAVVEGFWLPGSKDLDSELAAHWTANDLDSEWPLCALDSLTLGRGYMVVGSPDEDGDSPIVTVESPFNLSCNWDPRTRRVTAAYQSYEVEGTFRAVLYLPDVTIAMSRDQSSPWIVDHRDQHNFGEVPVVRFPNRPRSADREGRSEITPAVRNTTDSACRTLLGMEIAREFYSVPMRYMLGASEDNFANPDGTPKAPWDMVMSKILVLERDEQGQVPSVGQFTVGDPSVYTKVLDKHAMLMASYTQFPPDFFGETTPSNPSSADAIRSAQDGLNRRARKVQGQFTAPLRQVAGLIWRFANRGETVPDEVKQLGLDWAPVETRTPAAMSDALFKQKQAGYVTSHSRPALRQLDYTAREIDILLADQKADPADQLVSEVASDLQATQTRTAISIEKDAANPPAPPVPPGT